MIALIERSRCWLVPMRPVTPFMMIPTLCVVILEERTGVEQRRESSGKPRCPLGQTRLLLAQKRPKASTGATRVFPSERRRPNACETLFQATSSGRALRPDDEKTVGWVGRRRGAAFG